MSWVTQCHKRCEFELKKKGMNDLCSIGNIIILYPASFKVKFLVKGSLQRVLLICFSPGMLNNLSNHTSSKIQLGHADYLLRNASPSLLLSSNLFNESSKDS